MRQERFERHRFAERDGDNEHFYMRFHRGMHEPHERFNVWYDTHRPHRFAVQGEERCEVMMYGRHRMHRHAWGEGEGGEPPTAMNESREHRRRFEGDRDDRPHHRAFDPYRDRWDSRHDGDANDQSESRDEDER